MKRLRYIDNARGILILLVILGHCFGTDNRLRFMYAFHVPAFFMISGYLFRESSALAKSLSANALRTFQRFLIPYLFFEALGGAVNVLFHDLSPLETIMKTLTVQCNVGADWFLFSTAAAEIIFIIEHKYMRTHKIIGIINALLMLSVFYMPKTQIYKVTGRAITALFFISVGYYAYYLFKTTKKQNLFVILSCIVTAVLAYTNPLVDVFPLRLGNPLAFAIMAITGTYFLILVCKYRIFNLFSFFGNLSLAIMGTHQVILPFLHCHVFIQFPLVLIIDVPIAYLLTKYCPQFLGNRRNQSDS